MNHKSTVVSTLMVIAAMLCLAYASVPIYRVFCRVTGYGGTTRMSSAYPTNEVGSKVIEVRFNADINPKLPWSFKPEVNHINLRAGEQKLMFYYAENLSDHSIDGMAIYNVTPHKVGKYFNKIACFCFEKQTLLPHQKVVMPVSFFVDPAIESDPDTAEVSSITLSYTFFEFVE